MTVKKIAVGQVTFVEVAADENTGIKFDIRQILIGIVNFCKGRFLLKRFFHYGFHLHGDHFTCLLRLAPKIKVVISENC
jgi:hypothetical protein